MLDFWWFIVGGEEGAWRAFEAGWLAGWLIETLCSA